MSGAVCADEQVALGSHAVVEVQPEATLRTLGDLAQPVTPRDGVGGQR